MLLNKWVTRWLASDLIWNKAIKTSASGNKGEQKRQTAEQLWQKKWQLPFCPYSMTKIRYSAIRKLKRVEDEKK